MQKLKQRTKKSLRKMKPNHIKFQSLFDERRN